MTNLIDNPSMAIDFKDWRRQSVNKREHATIGARTTTYNGKQRTKFMWYGMPWNPVWISDEFMSDGEIMAALPRGWDLRCIGRDRQRGIYIFKRGRYL